MFGPRVKCKNGGGVCFWAHPERMGYLFAMISVELYTMKKEIGSLRKDSAPCGSHQQSRDSLERVKWCTSGGELRRRKRASREGAEAPDSDKSPVE